MKKITYKILQSSQGDEHVFLDVSMVYSQQALKIAEMEAYNGEYEIIEE